MFNKAWDLKGLNNICALLYGNDDTINCAKKDVIVLRDLFSKFAGKDVVLSDLRQILKDNHDMFAGDIVIRNLNDSQVLFFDSLAVNKDAWADWCDDDDMYDLDDVMFHIVLHTKSVSK